MISLSERNFMPKENYYRHGGNLCALSGTYSKVQHTVQGSTHSEHQSIDRSIDRPKSALASLL